MADWMIFGCGYVGTRLAYKRLAAGDRVRVTGRSTARLEALAARGAEVIALDAARPKVFGPALVGLQQPIVVYSIPPVADLPAGEAARRAGEAARKAAVTRFIYLGSTAVYGATTDGEVVDEASPIAVSDPQSAPRITEEMSLDTLAHAGLPLVTLRLAAIYGPGRGVRERLRTGTYKLIDDGSHYFSRVHVADIVGIIEAAAVRAPARALYCVGDDRPSTQKEYADWLCDRMQLPHLSAGAPAHRAVRNRKIDNAKLKAELAYVFEYPSFVEGELANEAEQSRAPD